MVAFKIVDTNVFRAQNNPKRHQPPRRNLIWPSFGSSIIHMNSEGEGITGRRITQMFKM